MFQFNLKDMILNVFVNQIYFMAKDANQKLISVKMKHALETVFAK